MTTQPRHLLGIHLTLLLLCASAGCAHQPAQPEPPRIPASATTAPVGKSDSQLATLVLKGQAEFYMGDHLGRNLFLILMPGKNYSLTWHGCQGLYGAAIGKWQIKGDQLVLEPLDQSGRLSEHPLSLLRIRLLADGSPALIPEADMAGFLKEGVEDETCFRPFNLIHWR